MANDVNIRFTAEDVASEVVRRLGGNLGGLTDKVNPLNAAFGVLGATLTTGAVIGALKSTINALDELGDSAEEAGVTVEALSGLRYAATFAGSASDVLDKALIKLNTRLTDVAGGGKESTALFRALGVEARDSAGNILTSDAALEKLAARFAAFDEGPEKSALAVQVFGEKVGPKLLPLLNQGADGIARLREEAERLGVAVSGSQAAAAGKFADQMDRLALQFTAVRNNVATAVLPTLINLLDEVERGTRIFGSFGDAFVNLATVNPFRTLGGNIEATRKEIERLQIEQNRFRDEFGQDTDAGQTRRQLQGEIDLLQKRLQYLKETQQVRALEGSGGVLDPRDAQAQRGQGGVRAPVIGDPAAAEAAAKAAAAEEKERDRRNRERIIAAEKDALAQVATDKLIEDSQARQLQQRLEFESQVSQIGQRRLEAVMMQIATEEQLENDRFARQIESLQTALLTGAATEAEWYALKEEAETAHQERLTAITDAAAAKRNQGQKVYRQLDLQSASAFLNQMSVLMNTNSRKMFEVGKAAAIADTVIQTYKGAQAAFTSFASLGPWGVAAGVVAAGAAIAAGMARVQAIKSTQFGGGTVGSVATGNVATPGQGPFNVGPQATPATPTVQQAPAQLNLSISGSWFSAEDVRRLIDDINGQLGGGAQLGPA